MSDINGVTGVMPEECSICGDDADWEFTRKTGMSFFICNECQRIIIRLNSSQCPDEIDLPYIWYLRTSREMQKNEESEHIQNIIKEGLDKLDKYKLQIKSPQKQETK